MKPIKRLPNINSNTTKEIKDITNDQSKNRTDHEYLKMIHRVLDKVFPDY